MLQVSCNFCIDYKYTFLFFCVPGSLLHVCRICEFCFHLLSSLFYILTSSLIPTLVTMMYTQYFLLITTQHQSLLEVESTGIILVGCFFIEKYIILMHYFVETKFFMDKTQWKLHRLKKWNICVWNLNLPLSLCICFHGMSIDSLNFCLLIYEIDSDPVRCGF